MDRIRVAKGSIKHTNNMAIITLFVYNKERNVLMVENIERIERIFNISTLAEECGRTSLKY